MMERLLSDYKNGNVILFVGAGASMNLNLPSWHDLIDHIAEELGYDPKIYHTFGDYLQLAEYYTIKKGNIGPLRSWMDRQWDTKEISTSKIHEYIAKSKFQIIYTTNYDRLIEMALEQYEKEFTKIISVSDMANIDLNKKQVIKFHGDFDDDSSIVFNETSYYERLDFETPLDIKFRADILGKSVLFIGYSLSDLNIRLLFYKLSKFWQDKHGADRPRSYIFSLTPNPIQEAILDKWGITMISQENENVKQDELLEKFLEKFIDNPTE